MGSGHPLADVMLLKHRPQSAEVQEGVAFYGRAGQAILKSLQRLHVDPMSVYGTNCVKFADGDEDESRPFLTRELHIVQPKLIVPMGESAVGFLNSLDFPLADTVEYKPGELQRFTATVQALVVPDIDASLDEAPGDGLCYYRICLAGDLRLRAEHLPDPFRVPGICRRITREGNRHVAAGEASNRHCVGAPQGHIDLRDDLSQGLQHHVSLGPDNHFPCVMCQDNLAGHPGTVSTAA